jgi:hypothetical protein
MDTLAQARGGGEDAVHCSSEKMAANTLEHHGSGADEDTQQPKQIASTADDESSAGTKRNNTDNMSSNMTERQGSQVDEDTERPKQIAVTADDHSSMRTKRSKEEQPVPVDTNHQECNVSLRYSKPPYVSNFFMYKRNVL